jgi:hypothetical protein
MRHAAEGEARREARDLRMAGVISTNWKLLLVLAREAADRASSAVAANSAVATSDAIVAIVMATSATECFINEFAEVASVELEESEALRAMADAVLKVEANKGSLESKVLFASLALTGAMFDKGAQPWQDFAALVRLRNALVHLRPGVTGDDQGVLGPRVLKRFEGEGLTYPIEPGVVGAPWTLKISTDRMARWAYNAALRIIRAIVEMAPKNQSVETLFAWPMHSL